MIATSSTMPDLKNGILAHHLMRELTGLIPVTGDKKVTVTFSGDGAFVNFNAAHVNIPALPNLAVIPLTVAREIRGFAAHESAHLVFSDPNVLNTMIKAKDFNPLLKSIWNSIEDYMIEREWMKIYPGARKNFAATEARCSLSYMAAHAKNPNCAKDLRAVGPVALTWMRAVEFGINAMPTDNAIDTLPEGLRQRVEQWQRDIQHVVTSQDCLDAARKIVAEIEKDPIDPNDPPLAPQKEQQGDPQSDPQDSGGDQMGQPGEGQPGEGQPGQGQPGEGDGKASAGHSGDDKSGDVQPGDEQIGEKGGGSADGRDGKAPGKGRDGKDQAGEGQDGKGQDGKGAAAKTITPQSDNRGDALTADDEKKAAEEAAKADGQKPGDKPGDKPGHGPDQSVGASMRSPIGGTEDWKKSEALANAKKAAAEAAKNGPAPTIYIRDDGLNSVITKAMKKAEKFFELSEKDAESIEATLGVNTISQGKENAQAIRKECAGVTAQFANGLRRALQSRARTKIKGGRMDGLLDPRSLSKAITGSTEIYNKRTERRDENTAVTLLIDLSGSMVGNPVALCQQMTLAVWDTLRRSDVKLEILGYACGRPLFEIKAFADESPAVEGRIGMMHRLPGGGTGTGEAILEAGRRLMARTERRKVMLVQTDGCANNPEFARKAAHVIHANGVTVFGVGIGSSADVSTFPSGEKIMRIEELSNVMLQKLSQILLGERDKTSKRGPGAAAIRASAMK